VNLLDEIAGKTTIQWPVYRLTYKCLACGGLVETLGGSGYPDSVDNRCCTYHRALLMTCERIETPSDYELAMVYDIREPL
jgi:hypothetical protein